MMKIVRGVAAGSIVLASLSIFSACYLNWDDLPPLDSAAPDALTDAPLQAIGDAAGPGETGPSVDNVGCSSNADCPTGDRCYFSGGSPCTGTGRCVAATSACANNGAVGTTASTGVICGCDNLADACAPTGAAAECTGLAATSVGCGYVSCPTNTTFCDISQDGGRFECKVFTSEDCSTAHTCACAKKICDGGTCEENGASVVVTCP